MFNNYKKKFKEEFGIDFDFFEKNLAAQVICFYTLRAYIDFAIDINNDYLNNTTDKEKKDIYAYRIDYFNSLSKILADNKEAYNLFTNDKLSSEEIKKIRDKINYVCNLNDDLTLGCIALSKYCDIRNISSDDLLSILDYDDFYNEILKDVELFSEYIDDEHRQIYKEKMLKEAKKRGITQVNNKCDDLIKMLDDNEKNNNIKNVGGMKI